MRTPIFRRRSFTTTMQRLSCLVLRAAAAIPRHPLCLVFGVLAILTRWPQAAAAARTGVCTKISTTINRGMCKGTTLPLIACVPDDTTPLLFEKSLSDSTLAASTASPGACHIMKDFVKMQCSKLGGSMRPGTCDPGGGFCWTVLASIVAPAFCDVDATTCIPRESLGDRLPCCNSSKPLINSMCDVSDAERNGVITDWKSVVCSHAPPLTRPRASGAPARFCGRTLLARPRASDVPARFCGRTLLAHPRRRNTCWTMATAPTPTASPFPRMSPGRPVVPAVCVRAARGRRAQRAWASPASSPPCFGRHQVGLWRMSPLTQAADRLFSILDHCPPDAASYIRLNFFVCFHQ